MKLRKEHGGVREVRLILTNRCNFRCYFCFNEGYSTGIRNHELRSSDYLRAVRHLSANHGLGKVRLSGGEPTLDPELPRLIGMLLNESPKLDVGVTTNGSRPDRMRDLLHADDARRLQVNVSLPAANASQFRAMTGSGRLADVMSSIRIAASSGNPVKINCVVTRRDDAVTDVIAIGAQLGVSVKLLCLNINPHNEHEIGQRHDTASGVESIQRTVSGAGYRLSGMVGTTFLATRGSHTVEIVDCSTSDPIEYFRRFRALRVYFDGHLAVTGDFDGYWRPFDPASSETALDSLVSDITRGEQKAAES